MRQFLVHGALGNKAPANRVLETAAFLYIFLAGEDNLIILRLWRGHDIIKGTIPMTSISRLRRDDAVLLVVDVQEKLVPAMFEAERIVRGVSLLAQTAKLLDTPVVVTEQNPERLGATVEPVRRVLDSPAPIAKMRFSACVEETMTQLRATGRKSVVLCGLEAHVCVTQTALDLIEDGFTVWLPQDAVSSRYESDKRAGIERMKSAGVVAASIEMLVFELLGEAGTAEFRALLPHLK